MTAPRPRRTKRQPMTFIGILQLGLALDGGGTFRGEAAEAAYKSRYVELVEMAEHGDTERLRRVARALVDCHGDPSSVS